MVIDLLYIAVYLIFINIVAAIVCAVDKIKARFDGWRVSEKTLFIISFIGGALGMYIAMKLIRHKTQHKRFMIGLPTVILLHCECFV